MLRKPRCAKSPDFAQIQTCPTYKMPVQTKKALNNIVLPENVWNPDAANYIVDDFHFQPLDAGLVDGALEEIKSIPLLISLVVDYATNPTTQDKINKAVSDFDFKEAMKKWYEGRKELYTTGSIHQIEHRTGKDIVEVGTLLGTGGLASLGKVKKGVKFVEELVEKVKKIDNFGDELANAGAKLSKSNLLDVSWVNNISGHRSVNNALKFWKNTSKEFEHLIEGDLYLKFDKVSGDLLFGNHKTKEILGFYEGALNVSTVNKKGLDGVLGKLKAYHGVGSPSYINLNVSSGAKIIANPNKTATIVGNYKRFPWNQGDMKELIPELLGDLKTQQFGPKKGGFNILNVADEVIINQSKFWDNFNKPWLDAAIKRGDDIWAASNPMELNLLFKKLDGIPVNKLTSPDKLASYLKNLKDPKILKQITGFGNELKLLSENGYVYNQTTKLFVK